MKRTHRTALLRACAVAIAAIAAPQAIAGHYVTGVEGMQGPSVPPPGKYYVGYLVNYNIDKFRAPGSSSANLPGSNTGSVTALANRFVWITDKKVLGANYGAEVIVPIISTSLKLGAVGLKDSGTGIGDIYVGPLVLGWHGKQWDAVVGAGMWLDTGKSSHLAAPGKGYKGTMLSGGVTVYFDEAKTVTGSALMRYEMNGKDDSGVRPGDLVSLEWGLGKNLGKAQVGLVGYNQWQATADSGIGSKKKSSLSAIGGEVVYPIMSHGVFLKGALYKEIGATGGAGPQPQGTLLRFTLVKVL